MSAATQPSIQGFTTLGLSAIDQVGLSCTNLDAAERFYVGLLGLRLAGDAPPTMKFFDCAGVYLIMTKEPTPRPGSIVYFKVDGVAGRIQEKVAALRAAGVTVDSDAKRIAANWNGHDVWLAFFKDPFGNQLALKSDVPVSP